MFRFSTRDLLLAIVVVGIGLAWFSDRGHLRGALIDSKMNEARLARRVQVLQREREQVSKSLATRGLAVWDMCGAGVAVSEIRPNERSLRVSN